MISFFIHSTITLIVPNGETNKYISEKLKGISFICLIILKIFMLDYSFTLAFIELFCSFAMQLIFHHTIDISINLFDTIMEKLDLGIIICKNNEILHANLCSFKMLNVQSGDLRFLKQALLNEYGVEAGFSKKPVVKPRPPTMSSSEFLLQLRLNQNKPKFSGKFN